MKTNTKKNKNNLVKMSELVEELLIKDEKCRNSDAYLYFQVLDTVSKQKGIDINNMTVPEFLLKMHGNALPIFETIRRTRQKVQELHPELCPSDNAKLIRKKKESEFRDYALNYT
jgi:predicted HAD superfamily hydrolase